MPLNNMQEAVEHVCSELRHQLEYQGVEEEQIKKVIEDVVESINYNVKWGLKCQ